ncbi:PfkB family carbohydrate kinase [Sphaerisporangium sp. NPDC005288]|uniref:PfkB family carbohydrate kinase n=1 Tax=Sphaerisporangium sp. NPDC005288 TaxID=3155114 RepID=UPI0033BE8280
MTMSRALFAGLCTLDLVQSVERMPSPNEKITALAQVVAAGGPATNAAVAFSHLGGEATLLSAVGAHPLVTGIDADLAEYGVRRVDATPAATEPPAVSTIMVTRGSGDRAVVSVNAAHQRAEPPSDLASLVAASQAVHLDGHHPRLALAAARAAREQGRLTVLDAGSWKPGTAELLPYIDVAVASADFHPPGTRTPEEALAHLHAVGVPWTAVTRGPAPVLWRGPRQGHGPDAVRTPSSETLPAGRATAEAPPSSREGRVASSLGGGEDPSTPGETRVSTQGETRVSAPGGTGVSAPSGTGMRPVPRVDVVDTLGAGDVLHGALTFALCRAMPADGGPAGFAGRLDSGAFIAALDFAIAIASRACRSFGTRSWTRP